MKKLLLILVLALMSSSVMAEWTRVDYDSGNGFTTYVNFFTIEKSDRTVKMWSLVDYKKAQERAFLPLYLSINRQNEFNCMEGQALKLIVIFSFNLFSINHSSYIFYFCNLLPYS